MFGTNFYFGCNFYGTKKKSRDYFAETQFGFVNRALLHMITPDPASAKRMPSVPYLSHPSSLAFTSRCDSHSTGKT